MGIRFLPGVYTAALGLFGAGAVVIWPNNLWIGYSLLLAAALLALWGIRLPDGRHLWVPLLTWLDRNIWWRFSLSPPDRVGTAPPPPASHSTPIDYLSLTPARRPDFDKVRADGFDYPYPKAVLKAEIEKPRGTRERKVGAEKPHRATIVMALKNDHGKLLTNCSVAVVAMAENGDWTPMNERLMVGSDVEFSLSAQNPRRFPLIARDMSDPITPAPFILKLENRQLPLKEATSYLLVLELRSRYPLPTIVYIQIDTGTGLDVQATVIGQKIAEQGVDAVSGAKRDVPLSEALAYAITGQWGCSLTDSLTDDVSEEGVWQQSRQLAHDQKLTIWGKRSNHGVYEVIPPEFWIKHQPEWFSLLRGSAHTEATAHDASNERYSDLMTSRAEVESLWPK